MIHEFKIKNVLSFKEEQVLSFEATSDDTYESIYCAEVKPSFKLLKLAMIYGANASGKTNLLIALNFLRKIVLHSKEDKFEKIDFIPFMLDGTSKDLPGEFYLSFFINDKRYVYTIHLDKKTILKEELIYYPKTQPALLFERKYNNNEDVSEIKFGDKLGISSKDKLILEGGTIKNSTLLSIYLKLNISVPLLEDVVNWFKDNFMQVIEPNTDLFAWTSKKIENSEECKKHVLEALQKADFNISDILIEENEVDDELAERIQNSNRIPDKAKGIILQERKLKNISFIHSTINGHYPIPTNLQSSGTLRYYGMGGILSTLLQEENFLAIDEIESSLHFELVNHLLKTFLVNSTKSQLLFTTHNINILMEDFIRRDAVWFCEKNEDGATELFSASDFSLHKNISIFNAYRIGKLGAKPNLGSIYLDKTWQDKKVASK